MCGPGGVPALHEVRLHQGTVWDWNRVIYDPADGGHLRIEVRALPSGPGPLDMLANIAFLVGASRALADDGGVWTQAFPFEVAHDNFYRSAQFGLDATLHWPCEPGGPCSPVRAGDLLLDLLPRARQGLARAGIEPEDSDPLLSLLEARVRKGRTGSVWQRLVLDALEPKCGRDEALTRMLERYLDCSESGEPVHRWPEGT